MIDALYSNRILGLVANIPRTGRLAAPGGSAEKTAKLCGSRITVDVTLAEGRVIDFAQDVAACALGQASAAILGANVIGADLAEIELARDGLKAMLKTNGPLPVGRFSELSVLAGQGLSRPPRLNAFGVRSGGRGCLPRHSRRTNAN